MLLNEFVVLFLLKVKLIIIANIWLKQRSHKNKYRHISKFAQYFSVCVCVYVCAYPMHTLSTVTERNETKTKKLPLSDYLYPLLLG